MKQLSLQQSRIRLHTIGHGGTATVTETETPNPSVARGTNRVSQWAFRVVALLAILFNGSMLAMAASPTSPIKLKTSIPENNAEIASIGTISLEFDFSDVFEECPELNLSNVGLTYSGKTITLYKDSPSGEVVATTTLPACVNTSSTFSLGNTKANIVFDSDIILEDGQTYVLSIPAKTFYCSSSTTKFTKTVITTSIEITFIGKSSENKDLLLLSYLPDSSTTVKTLDQVCITFNQPIEILSGTKITLSEGSTLIQSVDLMVDDEDHTRAIAYFNNELLYNEHTYVLEIPENSIFIEGLSQNGYKKISWSLNGGGYKYFGYGSRVKPSTVNPISWLSQVKIPVSCGDTQYLGRTVKPKVLLYKDAEESANLIGEPITASIGSDMKSLEIDFYNFNLEADATYLVVMEADQFKLWDYSTQREIKDTSNEKLILTYTTQSVPELPAKVSVVVDPMEGVDNDRLDIVTLNLADYEFEGNSYPVQLAVENPVAIFNDGTNDTQLPLTFNANEKKAICAINRPLEAGKTYTLKVPAGTFAPNAHANLAAVAANDELVYTYTGKAVPATEYVTVTYTIEGVSAMQHEVEKGKAVSFTLTPADELWTVGNVENATLDEATGKYVTEPLEVDHEVKASFALVNPVEFDFTTEVDEIEGELAHSIYSDGNNLVVNGVTGGDRIRVYTTAGALMADKTVPEGTDTASISLDHGVYIVAVNAHVYKARH